jgi:hypothetical protein
VLLAATHIRSPRITAIQVLGMDATFTVPLMPLVVSCMVPELWPRFLSTVVTWV